jgi:hypothetical protein
MPEETWRPRKEIWDHPSHLVLPVTRGNYPELFMSGVKSIPVKRENY